MDRCWDHDIHYLSDFHVHAHETDDQLPLIAQVGRGLKGDSFRVLVTDDPVSEANTILEGQHYKEDTKTWQHAWYSENINGGRLHLYYHLNQNSVPQTFQMIFVYKRTGRTEWSWVSPTIPYEQFDNAIMGSTVGDIFVKDHIYSSGTTTENDKYIDMLTYPNYNQDVSTISRDDFNAPYPPGGKSKIGFPTSSGIRKGPKINTQGSSYQHGSEWNVYLDIPNMDELVSITGLSRAKLIKLINGVANTITPTTTGRSSDFTTDFNGVKSDNIQDYIDDMLERENSKRHQAINNLKNELENKINQAKWDVYNAICPVGGYLDFHVNVNPATLMPGTEWQAITDGTVLRAANNTNIVGQDSYMLEETDIAPHGHSVVFSDQAERFLGRGGLDDNVYRENPDFYAMVWKTQYQEHLWAKDDNNGPNQTPIDLKQKSQNCYRWLRLS